ncbi:MAG TPA: cupin-like domain-containing protein [Thermoanaerobaculia bacterium]|jgi:hypothetical protein
MRLQPVPTTPPPSRLDFTRYIRQPAHPLLVKGATDEWPAMRTWSLEFFANEFADFPVTAYAPQFSAFAVCGVQTTVASYVAYLRNPADARIDGTWLAGDPDLLKLSALTLYAGNFNPADRKFGNRELFFRDVPEFPPFIDSWMDRLDPAFREACEGRQSHTYVYLSAAGGVTPLHQDFWATHAFLAQIAGRKEAILFPPDLKEELYRDHTGDVRRMMADPSYDAVEGWRTELTPGDILIIPSQWLHYVETIETSLTYSAAWIDGSNWDAYVRQATEALGREAGESR